MTSGRQLVSWRCCTLVVILAISSLWSSDACFIRNCPRGGKRGMDRMDSTRQCMSCGPEGRGQCVGPSICCGAEIGCLMGTSEAQACQKENESTVPCVVKGPPCGVDGTGNCVAEGICCVDDACSYNTRCKDKDETGSESTREQLLTLIHRLLLSRQYD